MNGARQVGKTWLLKEFAQKEYAKTAYIVCRKNPAVKEIFKVDFNMDRILRALRALTGVDITPGDTLIVLDEIQDVPEALEALKYFREDASDYHVAVAGSLLGLSMHEGTSYPVGQVNTINIYPMNFEEFLLAKGEEQLQKLLASKDYQTTNLLHEKYTDLLRQYFYVGGMPEAVLEYVTTENLQQVRKIQQEILKGYDMDFSKHAPSDQVARIRMVWQTIPTQLFRENKKFIFGAVNKGSRAKDFEIALQWLCDAMQIVSDSALCEENQCILNSDYNGLNINTNPHNFIYMESVGNYANLCFIDNEQLTTATIRTTIKQLKEDLSGNDFIVQCHRGFLVNLEFVESMEGSNGRFFLNMFYSEKNPMSRANKTAIKETLSIMQCK